ncbi:hypothetical protein PMAYCL1PPCAC_28478, partial [Pristionchus mayeri]
MDKGRTPSSTRRWQDAPADAHPRRGRTNKVTPAERRTTSSTNKRPSSQGHKNERHGKMGISKEVLPVGSNQPANTDIQATSASPPLSHPLQAQDDLPI